MAYQVRSAFIQDWLRRHSTGSTMPSLSGRVLSLLPIVLPPVEIQHRIAAILGALDDKIELNRRMNRTLEEMAQALFKSWFIDFDGHEKFVDSNMGQIPHGWAEGSIETVGVDTGLPCSQKTWWNDALRWS
ncbi:MAG: restriction endonuclease subunit S [Alphaproteobacteria bacterium]|nr:restriction endonuclease subunit S [Alphaproteobacteria bacterium]